MEWAGFVAMILKVLVEHVRAARIQVVVQEMKDTQRGADRTGVELLECLQFQSGVIFETRLA